MLVKAYKCLTIFDLHLYYITLKGDVKGECRVFFAPFARPKSGHIRLEPCSWSDMRPLFESPAEASSLCRDHDLRGLVFTPEIELNQIRIHIEGLRQNPAEPERIAAHQL